MVVCIAFLSLFQSEAVSTDLLNKECYRWGKEIDAEFPAPPSDHEAVEEVWEMLKEDKKIQREMRHTWSMKKQIIQDMQANLQKRDASEIIAEEVFKWKEAQRVKKKAKKRVRITAALETTVFMDEQLSLKCVPLFT